MAIAANLVTVLTAKTDGFEQGIRRARKSLDDFRDASMSRLEQASGRYAAAQPAASLVQSERDLVSAVADARRQEERKALNERLARMSADADAAYALEESKLRASEARKATIRMRQFENWQKNQPSVENGGTFGVEGMIRVGVAVRATAAGVDLLTASFKAMRTGSSDAFLAFGEGLPIFGHLVTATKSLAEELTGVLRSEEAVAAHREWQAKRDAAIQFGYDTQQDIEFQIRALTLKDEELDKLKAEIEHTKTLDALQKQMENYGVRDNPAVLKQYESAKAAADELYARQVQIADQAGKERRDKIIQDAIDKSNLAEKEAEEKKAAEGRAADDKAVADIKVAQARKAEAEIAAIEDDAARARAELAKRQADELAGVQSEVARKLLKEAHLIERANLDRALNQSVSAQNFQEVDTAYMSGGTESPVVAATNAGNALLQQIRDVLEGKLTFDLVGG